jgi:hypothetical protein
MVDQRDTPIVRDRLIFDRATGGVANALVYLVKPTSVRHQARQDKPRALNLVADRGVFVPHVVAAMEETKIVVETNDPIAYNFHVCAPIASARFPSFARGAGGPPPDSRLGPADHLNVIFKGGGDGHGRSLSVMPRAIPWPVDVRDDIHPWMSAWWMIFDHPYFAVTDSQGRFTLRDVPTGPQRLVVWHEALNPSQPRRGVEPRYVYQGEVVIERGSTRIKNFVIEPGQIVVD